MNRVPAGLSRAASAFAAAAVLFSTLSVAAPAFAGVAQTPKDFDRQQVTSRALKWARGYVPYSQSDYYRGWRQDCSGFVSMAWGLDESRTTWTLADIARPIPKWALQPGDVLINNASVEEAHVVIFDKWANKEHTAYWEYEQSGSVGKTAHRVVPYPFWTSDRDSYIPYRFTGGVSQYVRKPKPAPARPVAKSKPATVTPVAKKPAASTKRAAAATSTKAVERPGAGVAPKPRAVVPAPESKPATPSLAKRPASRLSSLFRAGGSTQEVLRDPVVVMLVRDLVAWIVR